MNDIKRIKSLKTLIILMLILILALILIIYLLKFNNNKDDQNQEDLNINENERLEENILNFQIGPTDNLVADYTLISDTEYIALENCILKFFNTINKNTYLDKNGKQIVTNDEISNMIIDMLSEHYIKNSNITVKNVKNYVYNIQETVLFVPTSIKKYFGDSRVNSYLIKGNIENLDYKDIMEINLIVNLDNENNAFSIEILNKNISKAPIQLQEIRVNDYNKFENEILTEQEIIKKIINRFKRTILGYPEIFYNNFLNEDYKISKFSNFEDFENYIEKNKSLITRIDAKKYISELKDGISVYSIKDQYENTIVIEYKSMLDYKLYLDNYTVQINQLEDEYNKSDDFTKVSINVGKLKQMINTKDYNAIYNRLNETFRKNNFSSVSKLEKYLKQNAYEINSIKVEDKNQQDDYYVCSCTLVNQENTNETKKMTVMIKLENNNNFSMSFNIG